ncbi:MAG: hypothetical protein QNJ37_01255 [Crocosphaera sp.]|nr:hypothetical protein [Crocosphaera sp.]
MSNPFLVAGVFLTLLPVSVQAIPTSDYDYYESNTLAQVNCSAIQAEIRQKEAQRDRAESMAQRQNDPNRAQMYLNQAIAAQNRIAYLTDMYMQYCGGTPVLRY